MIRNESVKTLRINPEDGHLTYESYNSLIIRSTSCNSSNVIGKAVIFIVNRNIVTCCNINLLLYN